MKKRIQLLTALLVVLSMAGVSGCRKSEDVKSGPVKPEKAMDDYAHLPLVHLYSDTVYTLAGVFTRENGEQLIIDEGTLIKVKTGDAGGAIRIDTGGTLVANGSQKAPIVFTSNAPPGTQGDNWGGITIRGRGINNSRGTTGDDDDLSGTLRYVRIEFGSLTLDAVGKRSIIENIMVSYCGTQGQQQPTSSINILGGSFNCRNLISYACGGPTDFYISSGYRGYMQGLLAYRYPYFGATGMGPYNALAGVFIENNPYDPVNARPYTYPYISNLTVIGPDGQQGSPSVYSDSSFLNAALVTTGSTCFRIRNSILLGWPNAAWQMGDSLTGTTVVAGASEFTRSAVFCQDSNRSFRLTPDIYHPYDSRNFKEYMLQEAFKNVLYGSVLDLQLADPFNYYKPDPSPKAGSPLLKDADFTGAVYSNGYFIPGEYIGALGSSNWLKGWTNFTPLKTNYNFSR